METEKDKIVLNKTNFTKMIEERIVETKGTYIESIIELCDDLDIDYEDVKKFISPIIKSRLEVEASKNNMIKNNNNEKALNFDYI